MENVTSLLVYVDDIIVAEADIMKQERLKDWLAREYKIKNLGRLKYFLEIEVTYSKKGIGDLSFSKKVCLRYKATSTLVELNLKIGVNPNTQLKLVYLSHTRLDTFSYEFGKLIYAYPNQEYILGVRRILSYLLSMSGKGIPFNLGNG